VPAAGPLRRRTGRRPKGLALTLIVNWLIAGTGAHAKNYSLLLEARGRVRLAPLYDLGSALPYPGMDQRRLKLAMKFGDTYRVREVGYRQLEQLADALALDPAATLQRAAELTERLLACVPAVRDREKQAGLTHPMVDRFSDRLTEHLQRCAKALHKPA